MSLRVRIFNIILKYASGTHTVLYTTYNMSQMMAADLDTHEHEPDEHDGGQAEQDHQGHLHSSSQPAVEKEIST